MRHFVASLALVGLSIGTPLAPSVAQSPGMQIVDTTGAPVGTVVRLEGENVVIKTDRHEVALPKTSFTPHEGKLLFGMSRADLNAATDRSLAEAAAAIVAGATVKGSAGTVVGTIDAVETDFVTIKLASGKLVRIPRSGIAAANGGVVIGLTAQELEAQVGAETQAPAE